MEYPPERFRTLSNPANATKTWSGALTRSTVAPSRHSNALSCIYTTTKAPASRSTVRLNKNTEDVLSGDRQHRRTEVTQETIQHTRLK